jgi:hypothetical protein
VKKIISISIISLLVLPFLSSAQKFDQYLGTAIGQGKSVLAKLVTFFVALAVVWFIWNVVTYSMSSEEDDKKKAKDQMVNGIIAIAVIVSIWGIVSLLRIAFGVDGSNSAFNNLEGMIPGQSNSQTSSANSSGGFTNLGLFGQDPSGN